MNSALYYLALFFVLLPVSAVVSVTLSLAAGALKAWLHRNRRGAWRIARGNKLNLHPRR